MVEEWSQGNTRATLKRTRLPRAWLIALTEPSRFAYAAAGPARLASEGIIAFCAFRVLSCTYTLKTNSAHQCSCFLVCLVPKRGLEPPRLAAPASKAGVSTNSTTWAGGWECECESECRDVPPLRLTPTLTPIYMQLTSSFRSSSEATASGRLPEAAPPRR